MEVGFGEVTVEGGAGLFGHELAGEAEEVDAEVVDALAEFGLEDFDDGGFVVGDLAGGLDVADAVAEVAQDVVFDDEVGEAEAVAVAAVGGAIAEGAGEDFEGAALVGGDADAGAFEIEQGHADVPAAVFFADEVVDGDADVFEEDFVEVVAAGHVDEGADLEAGTLVMSSMRRKLMPRCFGASGSVRTRQNIWLARWPPEVQIFWPLMM